MTTSREAGLALIGSVMATNGQALDDIHVYGDDFAEPTHGAVYDAAVKLYRDGKGVDLITLSDAVPENHRAVVYEAMQHSLLAYNVREWADIVLQDSFRRRISEAGLAIAGLDPNLPVSELIDRARKIVDEVTSRQVKNDYRFVHEMVDEVLDKVASAETFMTTPWRTLDKAIGGFRPGAVYVVAARPGVGKSVVAAQIATRLADFGAVAFSSLEMSASELVQRFISERALVNVGNLKNNKLTYKDHEKIRDKRSLLQALNIAVDDRTNVTPADVRAFVRSLSRGRHISGIVVDYLQLMSSRSKAERYQQVSEFSREMKILAKDFDTPVIVLSQLNRAVEGRTSGRPMLSDLRESGAIEQDADVVMLLRREGEQPRERLIIDVAKNRHGDTWQVDLDWQGMYSRAVDLDD